MKKITLNALLFSLLVSFSFLFVVSCSEDNIEIVKESASVEKLLLDENFIAISETMYDYALFVKNTIEEKGLSSTELLPQIDAIINDESLSENRGERLNEIFKTDISQKIESDAAVISTNMAVLNSKYSNIDEDLLSTTVSKHFENRVASHSDARNCLSDFLFCTGITTMGGGLCFGGCTSATVGIGLVPCAVFCGTLSTGAIVACYDNYCN